MRSSPSTLSIRVINLARSIERRNHIAQKLDEEGLSFEFFDAIDGDRLSVEGVENYDRENRIGAYGYDLSAREIACYLSHLCCIERTFHSGCEKLLVLEDDVDFEPGFRDVVEQCSALPEGYDLVRLMGLRHRQGIPVRSLNNNVKIYRPLHGVCGAQAYIIDRNGMQKILSYGSNISMQYDIMIDRYWENGLRIYCVMPFVVRHCSNFASTIGLSQKETDPWRYDNSRRLRTKLRMRKMRDVVARSVFNMKIILGTS